MSYDFKETIRARAQRDGKFRQALLQEAIETSANGDSATGNAILRDYINATSASPPAPTNTPSKRTAV